MLTSRWRNLRLPGRAPIAALLISAVLLTLWSEQSLFGKEAGVTMLVVLMSLKTLELRARRDALVVFFLGFFLVLTHFLYSQSLFTALAMLVSVWGLLTALVLAHMPVGKPSLRQAGALAARSALFGAPFMVALFILFPRIGPLWGMPQDALGRTGLSGTLRLGGVAEVANDDSIAFRVRPDEGLVLQPESLYFRGPVLTRFDGVEWRRRVLVAPPGVSRVSEIVRTQGVGLRYEMTLEPIRLPLLPLLEITPNRPDAAPQLEGYTVTLRPDLQWQTDRIVTERVRFSARAWPRFEYAARTRRRRARRSAVPATRVQPAHHRMGGGVSPPAGTARRRRGDFECRRPGAHPRRRVQLHAGAGHLWARRHR